jgi:tetratricopeptide (TPR) repeat protein
MDRRLTMDPADPRSASFVDELLEQADALNERGAYEAGLRLADDIIARDGGEAAPWTTRGWALENLGRVAEAEQAYAMALQLDPDSPWAAVGLATVLERTGRRAEASHIHRAVADRRVPPDEQSTDLLEIVGWSCFKTGRNGDAQRLFRRALDLEPGRIAARFDLALAMLADGQVDAALREYREGLEYQGDMASVRAHAAVALEDLIDTSRHLDGMDVAAADRLLRGFLATPSPDR